MGEHGRGLNTMVRYGISIVCDEGVPPCVRHFAFAASFISFWSSFSRYVRRAPTPTDCVT